MVADFEQSDRTDKIEVRVVKSMAALLSMDLVSLNKLWSTFQGFGVICLDVRGIKDEFILLSLNVYSAPEGHCCTISF